MESAIVNRCTNEGHIKGLSVAGGIVAQIKMESSGGERNCGNIYNCSNYGQVNGQMAGGIIGYISLRYSGHMMDPCSGKLVVEIKNSINNGAVFGENIGGICGYCDLYCCAHNNRYGNFFYFKTIVYMNNCVNNSNNAVCGYYSATHPEGDYQYMDSDSKLALSGSTYWLLDIVNNVGKEYAIENKKEYDREHWYSHSSTSCLVTNTSDLLDILNRWCQNNNSKEWDRWIYKTIDGYACPVLDK